MEGYDRLQPVTALWVLGYLSVPFVTVETLTVPFHVSERFLFWILLDLVQGVGTTLNLRWVITGSIPADAYCRLQGTRRRILDFVKASLTCCFLPAVLKQIGESGAAMCVIVITVLVLIRNIYPALLTSNPRRLSIGLIASISIALLLLILIPSTTLKDYYANTG